MGREYMLRGAPHFTINGGVVAIQMHNGDEVMLTSMSIADFRTALTGARMVLDEFDDAHGVTMLPVRRS